MKQLVFPNIYLLIHLLLLRTEKKTLGARKIDKGTKKSFPKAEVSLVAVSHLAGDSNSIKLKGESRDQASLSLRLRFPFVAGPFERRSTVVVSGQFFTLLGPFWTRAGGKNSFKYDHIKLSP